MLILIKLSLNVNTLIPLRHKIKMLSQMFKGITEEEQKSLQNAIPQITVLIAGADGNVDTVELEWAAKLTHIRSYAYAEELKPYYTAIGETFEHDVKTLIAQLPDSVKERTAILSEQLKTLNEIFPKLNNEIAVKLYETFLSFADHVAKASGGILRFYAVSKEEKELITLPMITPILLEMDEGDS